VQGVELGRHSWRRDIDETVRSLLVEPDHPVPQRLTIHATDLGRLLPRDAVEHSRRGLPIDGPILFPVDEDLPFLARAMPRRERNSAIEIAKSHDVKELERNLPISFIGTGKDLNLAIDNGLQRAADLLQMSVPDVKNRATILGGIEIGRSPGVARVTFRAPTAALERVGLRALAEEIYGKAQI